MSSLLHQTTFVEAQHFKMFRIWRLSFSVVYGSRSKPELLDPSSGSKLASKFEQYKKESQMDFAEREQRLCLHFL